MVKKPTLIAFDLDFTLWPFAVDMSAYVAPPFSKNMNGQVVDTRSRKIKHFKEVPSILKRLHHEGYILAIASRTGDPEAARQLLKLFNWEKYFTYIEIYRGSKITHFKRFKSESGIDFSEMLLFDDEHRNKRDLDTIGVMMIMVIGGVTHKLVTEGLDKFSNSYEQK
ncbi:magnesium-dependent phosphatase 1-like [Homarus americanus]|uniref:Magnesium-dependent phosphatase 1-like 2 n=1 Tax=Homarus americanus TaxID=6706 RepID=A0A8J5NAU4_HOMAM|nr:magnesium-dependent phosphatase 1-like [Homarus americanus]XP_042243555.1 magnesium-dependent phosphatase 1-like [Homarus americanus]XP_042243562.1 magnesium-dependent phosphatase 1-like [Homarus americanus]KAG7176003.1 Magnesium-dependent phosphatase 1-like 2 [Homarus americanus]